MGGVRRVEVLARWRERLRLTRVDAPSGTRFLVEELDERGAVVYSVDSGDDLFAAIEEYTRRTLRTVDGPAAATLGVMDRMIRALGAREYELVAPLIDESFRLVDHRAIGWPELDRAGLIAGMEANDGTRSRYLAQELHVATEEGAVFTGGFWTDEYGQWSEFQAGASVTMIKQGRVTRMDLYPEEQLDAALARFAELTSSIPFGDA